MCHTLMMLYSSLIFTRKNILNSFSIINNEWPPASKSRKWLLKNAESTLSGLMARFIGYDLTSSMIVALKRPWQEMSKLLMNIQSLPTQQKVLEWMCVCVCVKPEEKLWAHSDILPDTMIIRSYLQFFQRYEDQLLIYSTLLAWRSNPTVPWAMKTYSVL